MNVAMHFRQVKACYELGTHDTELHSQAITMQTFNNYHLHQWPFVKHNLICSGNPEIGTPFHSSLKFRTASTVSVSFRKNWTTVNHT